jgi:protein phosphatase
LAVGDVFVLCSDGLSGQVTDREIGAVASALPPADACRFLVDLSNLRGGPDNVTVIIVRVVGATPETKPAANPATPPGPPARSRWPLRGLAALLVGVAFSLAALLLLFTGLEGRARVAFVLAAVALIVGLIGLGVQYVHDRRRKVPAVPVRRLKVYRQTACQVEPAMLKHLTDVISTLQRQVREKNLGVDWETYQKYRAAAETNLAQNNLAAALCDSCRAAHLLADAVHRFRQKDESPQAAWVKPDSKA